MATPEGFAYEVRSSGDVMVWHHGRPAAALRGRAAARFRDDIAAGRDEQQLLARLTGNYKRGNERRSS
ncbi:hypothetical protein [Microcella sp.]|uniref:hypothetical protein n=1 Tax=Microcella sp. TaxID=1913979 RepID=UPI00255D7D5E|nr:hypothetical protein [Microcella sp.]MBX9471235.1 hypothetical protein [Microcella sp.]